MRTDATTYNLVIHRKRHGRSGHNNCVKFWVIKAGSKYTNIGYYRYFPDLEHFEYSFTFLLWSITGNNDTSGYGHRQSFRFFQKPGKYQNTLPLASCFRIHQPLDERTDKTWPTTWFVPNLTGEGAFTDVYHVMANWGANHGCLAYGHIGADLITLASMLRIPVSMHNVSEDRIYRPHTWSAYGTKDLEAADYRACADYGPLY
mgnify:CR=1 FL=1